QRSATAGSESASFSRFGAPGPGSFGRAGSSASCSSVPSRTRRIAAAPISSRQGDAPGGGGACRPGGTVSGPMRGERGGGAGEGLCELAANHLAQAGDLDGLQPGQLACGEGVEGSVLQGGQLERVVVGLAGLAEEHDEQVVGVDARRAGQAERLEELLQGAQ